MNKIFMVDIETTSVDDFAHNDILQVALLELNWGADGFWHPEGFYERVLHSDRKAEGWAAKHMADLYYRSNQALILEPSTVRAEILSFLRSSGAGATPTMAGKNAACFDLPFLAAKGFLVPPGRNAQNEIIGDHHYRVYDLTGMVSFCMGLLGTDDRTGLTKRAVACYPEIALPTGRDAHDALFDCYYQTREVNGLLRLVREAARAGVLR